MPSLYGTSTSYTVTASNVISLYQVSTSTAVITATTYSTNLVGLYGGSYAALPTNAEQLIQLFDNNGNVHFFLDPITNSTTIYASFVGTASITLGNYLINGDIISNVVDDNINFLTNGENWFLNTDGSTSFPNYTFPAGNGAAGDVLVDNGSGVLYWAPNGAFDISTVTNQALFTTSSVTFKQLTLDNSTFANTSSVIQVNASGTSTYQPPHSGGYLFWGINKPGQAGRIVTDSYGANTSVWTGRRARGTASSSTAVLNGDILLRVAGTGYGTTGFGTTSSGYLDILATETHTDGAHGTRITLNTTNSGTNTVNASVSVRSDGTTITAPQVNDSQSVLTLNARGLTTYKAPSATSNGYVVWGINSGTDTRILLDTYDSTGNIPAFNMRRARGSATTPTAIQANDVLGSLRANGYGTTGFGNTSTAFINFSAIENFTDTAKGTRIQMYANPVGQNTADLIATYRADGIFVYTTASNNSMFTVQGTYPNLTYEGAIDDTLMHGVARPDKLARVLLDAYGTDSPSYALNGSFSGRRARGTAQAPTATQDGDFITGIRAYAYGTTGFLSTSSAFITLAAAENVTDTAAGGEIFFGVQTIGQFSTSTQQTILAINQNGLVVTANKRITFGNSGSIQGGSNVITVRSTGTIAVSSDDGSNLTLFGGAGYIITTNGSLNFGAATSGQLIWNGSQGIKAATYGITFPDNTVQTTAYTGTGFISTSSVVGLKPISWTGKLSDGTGQISTSTVAGLSTIGYTGKLSDGTGQISTSTVNGLSTIGYTGQLSDGIGNISTTRVNGLSIVGYTNNYNDLSNKPTIPSPFDLSTVTNQALFTTSSVQFSGLALSTGTVVQKTVSAGGFPLNSAGTASIFLSTGASPAMVVSNYSSNLLAQIVVRGYGQNNPGGTGATLPNPNLRLESSLGTNTAPTAITANSNIGGFIVGGYDGASWTADTGQSYNFLGWFATETMTNSGGVTQNAGSGFNIYTQPQWTRPGTNTTRQRFLITTWTTASGGPSVNNIVMGSGVDNTFPTMTMVDGTTYTGYGRASFNLINATTTIIGVPQQDTAPDNITLTGTNIISFVSGRRSAVSGRRNIIQSGDTLGGMVMSGQTTNNSTGIGGQTTQIVSNALETFSGTARGSNILLRTTNSGTNTLTTRLGLTDQLNSYTADAHVFTRNSGATPRQMFLSTSTTSINSDIIQLNGYANSAFPAVASFTSATITLFAPTLNVSTSAMTVPTSTGISGTGTVLVGGFDSTVFKTGKFVVSIVDGTNTHSAEVLLNTNGTGTANTVYATITVGTGVLGTFSSSITGVGGTAQLFFTPTGATSMTVKASLTTI